MKNIGVILARGASKRLSRKNVRPLAGIPLVAWACRSALDSNIERVILSTDDTEIASAGRAAGIDVPFMRPAALAEDFARDVDIILHAIDAAQVHYGERYETVVMIQSTTPFARPEHFNACIEQLEGGNFACVFTARKAEDHPRWTWIVDDQGHAHPYVGGALSAEEQHSQNLAVAFYPTGAAWAIDIDALRAQNRVYCEPLSLVEIPWQFSVDIDDARDWAIAEMVVQKFGIEPVEPSVVQS